MFQGQMNSAAGAVAALLSFLLSLSLCPLAKHFGALFGTCTRALELLGQSALLQRSAVHSAPFQACAWHFIPLRRS